MHQSENREDPARKKSLDGVVGDAAISARAENSDRITSNVQPIELGKEALPPRTPERAQRVFSPQQQLHIDILTKLFSGTDAERLASAKIVLGLFSENNASKIGGDLDADPKQIKELVDKNSRFTVRGASGVQRFIARFTGGSEGSRCYADPSIRLAALNVVSTAEFPSKRHALIVISQTDPSRDIRDMARLALEHGGAVALGEGTRLREDPASAFFSIAEERLKAAHAAGPVLDKLERSANIEIYRPSPADIPGILQLYKECQGDLVLKVPEDPKVVEAILDQLYIAKDRTTGSVAALLEIWTTANGGLKPGKIEQYATGPDTLYFEPSVKKLYLDRQNHFAYTKRVLVAPTHRSKGLSGIIRARGWQDLIYKGYEFTMGFLRFSPEPNVKSLVAHMIKAGGAIPVGIVKKDVNGKDNFFMMVHDPLERELGNLLRELTKKKP